MQKYRISTLKSEMECKSTDPQAAIAYISALLAREEFNLALSCAEKSIQLAKNCSELHRCRAKVLKNLGNSSEAIASYRKAIALEPDSPQLYMDLGTVYSELGDFGEAEAMYTHLINLAPNEPGNYTGFAECQSQRGRFKNVWQSSIDALPGTANQKLLAFGFGASLLRNGRHEEVQECVNLIQSRWPQEWVPLLLLAKVAEEEHAFDHAGDYLSRAFTEYPGEAYCISPLIGHLGRFGEWQRAREIFRVLYQAVNSGHLLLSQEDTNWDGGSSRGKTILLKAKLALGHGDMIFMVRFAASLKKMGHRVGVLCRPTLTNAMRTVPGVDFVVQPYDDDFPKIDCVVDPSLLWLLVDTPIDSVGQFVPYVELPKHYSRKKAPPASEGKLKVGVAWKSNDPVDCNQYTGRTMAVNELMGLAKLSGIRLFSLHRPCDVPELRGGPDEFTIDGLCTNAGDFVEVAAAIQDVDVVVTVDTSFAHLAGAMNKPTFCILPYAPDWFWMVNRTDSPWYPSTRLFRQKSPGNWSEAIAEVAHALTEFGRQARASASR
jgi:tetratricopeptide (TPR) repeat protein